MMGFKQFWLAILIVLSVAGTVHSADIRTGGGHVIQDEGTAQTQQPILNFTGTGIECSNGSGKTNCNVGVSQGIVDAKQYGASGSMVTTTVGSDASCGGTSVVLTNASSFAVGQDVSILGGGAATGNLTVKDATDWVVGKIGNAFDFDGSTDYVSGGDLALVNFDRTTVFSIEAWVKRDAASAYMVIIGKSDSSTAKGWSLRYGSDNSIQFYLVNTAGTNEVSVQTNSTFTDTTSYHHIFLTYSGTSLVSGVKIYYDGADQTLTTIQNNLTASIQTTANFSIGSRNNVNLFFNGKIDNVGIYTDVKTQSFVTAQYNNGNGLIVSAINLMMSVPFNETTGTVAQYWYNLVGGKGVFDITAINGNTITINPALVCSGVITSGTIVSHDDTQAIKDALATGYSVYLPKGNYNVSTAKLPIVMSVKGQRLFGDKATAGWSNVEDWAATDQGGSRILISTSTSNVIEITGMYNAIDNIGFQQASDTTQSATSGSVIKIGVIDPDNDCLPVADRAMHFRISDVIITGRPIVPTGKTYLWTGIELNTTVYGLIQNIQVVGFTQYAIYTNTPIPCGNITFFNINTAYANPDTGAGVGYKIVRQDHSTYNNITSGGTKQCVNIEPAADYAVYNMQFVNLVCEDNTPLTSTDGAIQIGVPSGFLLSNVNIQGISTFGNYGTIISIPSIASNVVITSALIEDNKNTDTRALVSIDGDDITFSGAIFRGTKISSTMYGTGVLIGATASNIVMSGLVVKENSTGISCTSGATNVKIAGVSYINNTTPLVNNCTAVIVGN